MKYILLFIFLFSSIAVIAQMERKYPLDFGDVYVLKVKITKVAYTGKCPCNLKKKCVLSDLSVSEVIYCPPNNSFDSTQLLSIKYITLNIKDKALINSDSSIIITARPSGSKYYLSYTRNIKLDCAVKYQFYHPYSFLSQLNPCGQKDRFEEYILKQ